MVDRSMITENAVHIYRQKLLWKHFVAWNKHVKIDNLQNLKYFYNIIVYLCIVESLVQSFVIY